VPIKIGFLDARRPSPAWAGGPVAAGLRVLGSRDGGKSFYTLPADHWNCAVGSHTHKIGLPADRGNELDDTIGFMIETRYLDAAEVATSRRSSARRRPSPTRPRPARRSRRTWCCWR
jgi:hypothetical protein